MAPPGNRCCPGVAPPFLKDGFEDPIERYNGIADAVESWLGRANDVSTPTDVGHDDEVRTRVEEETEPMPEPLYYLRLCERWGLPRGGGWTENPVYFLRDLEYAALGRERFRAAQRQNAQQQSTIHDADALLDRAIGDLVGKSAEGDAENANALVMKALMED